MLAVTTALACLHACALDLHGVPRELGIAEEPARRYRKVTAFLFSYCALDDRGAVHCWRRFRDESDALIADVPRSAFVDVAVGASWACGIRQDESLECWGDQRAKGTVPAGRFISIDIDGGHACALRRDHAIVCWGYDASHDRFERTESGPFLSVTAGHWDCGGLQSGGARCWQGQRPAVAVEGGGTVWKHWYSPPPERMRQIDEDGRLTIGDGVVRRVPGRYRDGDWDECTHCAIRSDGRLRCWAGRVSRHGYCVTRLSHRQTPRGRYVDVAIGHAICAVRDDGALLCWKLRY